MGLPNKHTSLAFANAAKVSIEFNQEQRGRNNEMENNDYGRKQTDQTNGVWIYIHRR